MDEFDFPVSGNFLEKLSDIQSGRISVLQMKEMLGATLQKFNISNLTAEELVRTLGCIRNYSKAENKSENFNCRCFILSSDPSEAICYQY